MASIPQNSAPRKPQAFKVPVEIGYLPLGVDSDGSRWLGLNSFSGFLGLSLAKDFMPWLDRGAALRELAS